MKSMRILALDGGGMKGVYACAYLQTLEAHFGVSLSDHFDLVAGTSTGGIIALGIGAGLDAADILSLYRDHGREIFPYVAGHRQLARRIRSGHAYGSEGLKRALSGTFQEAATARPLTMADAVTRLCVPAVNARDCSPRVFKAHKGEPQVAHLTRDLAIPMTDVALATAAAPWYLPIAQVREAGEQFTYLDGGLWANNPAVVAVTEAFTYYVGEGREFDCIELLSIGLPGSSGFGNDGKYRRGTKFVDQLLSYAMESSKTGAHFTARFLLKDGVHTYVRVQPDGLNEAQSKRLGLDAATEGAIGELAMLGKSRAEHDKNLAEIRKIFAKA